MTYFNDLHCDYGKILRPEELATLFSLLLFHLGHLDIAPSHPTRYDQQIQKLGIVFSFF